MDQLRIALAEFRQRRQADTSRETDIQLTGRIHHYCGLNSLVGILRSQSLWASDARFLNDSKELELARTWALAERQRILASVSTQTAEGYRSVLEGFFDDLTAFKLKENRYRVFCFCFCEAADDISLWRTYGQAGEGYCIDFSLEQIAALAKADLSISLAQISYDRAKFVSEFERTVIDHFHVAANNVTDYTTPVSGVLPPR